MMVKIRITDRVLKWLGACRREVEDFVERHPRGLMLSSRNAIKCAREGFDLWYFIDALTEKLFFKPTQEKILLDKRKLDKRCPCTPKGDDQYTGGCISILLREIKAGNLNKRGRQLLLGE